MKMRIATCDTSGCSNSRRRVLVVEYAQGDSPCLTQCRDCDPSGWQAAAERQKEEWLAGESL